MKVIDLYIKYDKCAADVVSELYEAYLEEQENGVLWERYSRCSKYSSEQKITAVKHYLEHGRNLLRTVRTLGCPSMDTFRA